MPKFVELWIYLAPETFFLVARHKSAKVDVPGLGGGIREAQGSVGYFDLQRPSPRYFVGFIFPYGIPVFVFAKGGVLRIKLHIGGRHDEAKTIDAIAESIDKHPKPVGIAQVVALRELLHDAVGLGIIEHGTYIYAGIIVEYLYLRLLAGSLAGPGLVEHKIAGRLRLAPLGLGE